MYGLPSVMKSSSHKTMTNITFIFETSPNTKPQEKKCGGHGIFTTFTCQAMVCKNETARSDTIALFGLHV